MNTTKKPTVKPAKTLSKKQQLSIVDSIARNFDHVSIQEAFDLLVNNKVSDELGSNPYMQTETLEAFIGQVNAEKHSYDETTLLGGVGIRARLVQELASMTAFDNTGATFQTFDFAVSLYNNNWWNIGFANIGSKVVFGTYPFDNRDSMEVLVAVEYDAELVGTKFKGGRNFMLSLKDAIKTITKKHKVNPRVYRY